MAQEKINEELMDAVHALVKIKKVPESVVFEALEMVLLTAYKKEHGNAVKAVSYTHLDVYKRQGLLYMSRKDMKGMMSLGHCPDGMRTAFRFILSPGTEMLSSFLMSMSPCFLPGRAFLRWMP